MPFVWVNSQVRNREFTWAMQKKDDFEDALRWGVAAGTASAKLPGVSYATLEQTEQVYKLVETRAAAFLPAR